MGIRRSGQRTRRVVKRSSTPYRAASTKASRAAKQIAASKKLAEQRKVAAAASLAILKVEQPQAYAKVQKLQAQKEGLAKRQEQAVIQGQLAVESAMRQYASERARGKKFVSRKQIWRAQERLTSYRTGTAFSAAIKNIDARIAWAKVETKMRAAEKERVSKAMAAVPKSPFAVQPASVGRATRSMRKRLRQMQMNLRVSGGGPKAFKQEQAMNTLRIQIATTAARKGIQMAAGLKAQASWAAKTSQTTARSRSIQQREARALGTLTGTAQKGATLVIGSAYAAQQKAKTAAAQKKQQEAQKKAGTAYSLVIPETLSLQDNLTGVKTSPDIITTSAPKPVVAGIGAPLSQSVSIPLMAGGSFDVKRPTPEIQGPKQPPKDEGFLAGALASGRALAAVAVSAITGPPIGATLSALALSKLGITDVPLKTVKKRFEISQDISEKIAPDPTLLGATIQQAIKQEPLTGTGRGFWYDVGSAAADIALIAAPIKKIPLPKIARIESGGQKVVTTLSVGLGTRSKIIVSKIPGGKVQFGKPTTYKTGSISAEPITATQKLRGVKLAADRPQVEQQIFTELAAVKAVKGITPKAVARAENIINIIKIGSKSKDPVRPGFKFPKQTFKEVSPTEQPSLFTSISKQQKLVRSPLGPIEGSLSQTPFVLPKYVTKAGDFDFNVSTFKSAVEKAVRTTKDIVADPGRKFTAEISKKQLSAKVAVTKQTGEKVKIGEFLNPEEKSAEGLSQLIKGDTLFGARVPKGTVKTDSLKVYGLQRQFLKKGESIFSLQKVVKRDPFGKKAETVSFELEPAVFRKTKEIAHFYGIAKTKQANLLEQGKTLEAAMLGKEIAKFKQLFREVDIPAFYRKKGIDTDPTTFAKGESLYTRLVESGDIAATATVTTIRGTTAIKKPTAKTVTTKESSTITKIVGKDKPSIVTKAKPKLDTSTSYAKLDTTSTPLSLQSRTLPYLSGYAKPPKISYRPSTIGKSPYTTAITRPVKVPVSSTTSTITKTIKGKIPASLISKPPSKPLTSTAYAPSVKGPPTMSALTGSKSISFVGKGKPSLISSLVSSPPKGTSSLPSKTSTPFRSVTTPSRPSVPSIPSRPSTPLSPPSTPSIGYPKSPPSPGYPGSPGYPPKGPPPRSPTAARFVGLGLTATSITERVKYPKFIPFWQRSRKPEPKYRPVKPGADYIGNVPVDKIVGIHGRSDIMYGKIRTARLEEEDILQSKRKYKSITSKKGRGLIGGAVPTGTKMVLHL